MPPKKSKTETKKAIAAELKKKNIKEANDIVENLKRLSQKAISAEDMSSPTNCPYVNSTATATGESLRLKKR